VNGKLQVFRGDQIGEEFDLSTPQVVIGRGDHCDIRFPDQSVSRVHARLVQEDGSYFIEDMGGRNGTFVNGELLVGKKPLSDSDRITISGTTLLFHCASPALSKDDSDRGMTIVGSIGTFDNASFITKASAERQLQAMLRILQALGGTLDLEPVLEATLTSLLEVFPLADRGLILVLENDKLIPKAFRHRSAAHAENIAYSRTIVQRALDRREATLMMDAGQEIMSQSIEFSGIRSAMCVPLFAQDERPLGVLQLDAYKHRSAFDQDDLYVLTCVSAPVAMALEHAKLAQLLRDIQLAQEVQRGFLPQDPLDVGEYRYWGHCQPARSVGGDFYNYFELPNGNQAALLGDVAGKGLGAAMTMVKAATVCWVALRNAPNDLAGVTKWVNREISHAGLPGQFVTCALCITHSDTHEVSMISAGHMSPLICRLDGSVSIPVPVEQNGLPLGVLEEFDFETVTAKLEPGESVVLYSDGVSEAVNSQGMMYTSERIVERLANMQRKSPEEIGRALLDDLQRYVGDYEQSDDISIVVFGRKDQAES
jgi:pSer/pThr/pTyr-binding forkhead associated (FHA) protein